MQGGIIDVDSVLVIENNGNKTYTFKIARAVSSPTVENLVLKKNEDESFSGVMLKYNFTAQEKQITALGHSVDYTNKIEVFPIENLNIAARVVSQTSGCYTVTWETGICGSGQHSYGQPCDLVGENRAGVSQVISVSNRCTGAAISDIGVDNNDNPSGGGGFDTGPWGAGSGEDEDPYSTPCGKLKELFNVGKANIKPLITGGMYSYINNSSDGETGIYIKKSRYGVVTTEIAPFTGDNQLPAKWGTSYYSTIHTYPKTTFPMFSYSDMMVLYNLEMMTYSYNNGHSSMLLVCEDDNGIKQTYAIVFENTGQSVEQVWTNPENIGCSPKQILKQMNENLKDLYDRESEKSNPNYERVFLQFNFGTNIGLYKANSDLTNWSKLTINENSDTATVIPTNCN